MAIRTLTTTLAVVFSAVPLTLGLPQITDATAKNPTVLTPWSSHPDCAAPATACKADCTKAVDSLCRKDLGTENIIETVGECTAWYLYQIGNTIPSFDQCYSAFAYINDAGKPGPDGCGGTFGGALGWDKNGDRTNDPAFAIYPKSGSGNCFKTAGDMSPPLPQDMLPDGACDATGYKLLLNCEQAAQPNPGTKIKARQDELPAPCRNTLKVAFECPVVQQQILAYHKCPGTEGNAIGGSGINT
ncbi:MAG: hypothetical protein Q9208_006594 [Pyrenodesmia sp. 3 TL-2023]